MLGKASNGVLRLDVDGDTHEIREAADLDVVLRGRVSPSSDKLSELVAMSDRDLFSAKATYLDHESFLEDFISSWMNGGVAVRPSAGACSDHSWDTIMGTVATLPPANDSLRFLAIERYRQYLRAVLKCLEGIAKGRLRKRDEDDSVGRLAAMSATIQAPPQQLLFDLRDLAGDATVLPAVERLPKGEVVSIKFAPHQSMPIRLAKYDFVLVSGAPFLLVDDTGADVRLPPGRMVLGRGTGCSVVLDPRYRSVSRKHVVINIDDDGTAHFTDISSVGTFLPAGAV
jgi:hypothetical protein